MRPPLNAGENALDVDDQLRPAAASMRPPLNAGENCVVEAGLMSGEMASMRPPLNAGENGEHRRRSHRRHRRFNEAPAERGGKPIMATASMRSWKELQ